MRSYEKLEKLDNFANGAISERCKRSLFYFLKTFWTTIIPETPSYNWHIRYICEILQEAGERIVRREGKLSDLLINIPPGTTKSTMITVMFPAWLWAIDPTIRVISNSYSSDLSTDHAVKSKDIITSELYQALFPHIRLRRDKRGKQAYGNTKKGSRETTSTGGGILGLHGHVIINDDPQSPKQAESDAHRIQAIHQTKTLSTRKVDKGTALTVTVMQRLNVTDVAGYLLGVKKDGIQHIKLPAELRDNCRPIPETEKFEGKTIVEWYQGNAGLLDPVRLTRRDMAEALEDLGQRGYAGQYDQNPTIEEGDIIKKEWLQIISYNEYQKRKRERTSIQFFMDTAYTDKSENDPTGIIAVDKIGNNIYILNRAKVRKEFPELIRWVQEWVKSHGYDNGSFIRVEPKSSGLSVYQTLKSETNLNMKKTPAPVDSKKTRLYSIAPKAEAGRVFLIEGAWNQDFISEVSGFPNMPHDEDVDLLVYAVNHFLKLTGTGGMSNILW